MLVILIYAASGPLTEFVRWFIEVTTANFEEMSRREQRVLLKEHWLGSAYKGFERAFLLPTGLILGLPILFAFAISFLSLPMKWQWLNWVLAALAIATFSLWVAKLFAVDGGALPSAQPIDFVMFPVATVLTLYLTWRLFGTFIVGFCLFWIVYFFVRGCCPIGPGSWQGPKALSASRCGRWC